MGMPRYDYVNIFVVVYGHLVKLFVYLVAEAGIGGCPCGVFYAASLKTGPEVPHEEFAEGCPAAAAFGICLVAVPEEDFTLLLSSFHRGRGR